MYDISITIILNVGISVGVKLKLSRYFMNIDLKIQIIKRPNIVWQITRIIIDKN